MKKDTKKEEYIYQIAYENGYHQCICANSFEEVLEKTKTKTSAAVLEPTRGAIQEIKLIGKKSNDKSPIYRLEKTTFSVVFETKSVDEDKMSAKNCERREVGHLSVLKKGIKELKLDKDTTAHVYFEKTEIGLGL